LPGPALQLLLSRDRGLRILGELVVDQPVYHCSAR
jgi:hypothetical protein